MNWIVKGMKFNNSEIYFEMDYGLANLSLKAKEDDENFYVFPDEFIHALRHRHSIGHYESNFIMESMCYEDQMNCVIIFGDSRVVLYDKEIEFIIAHLEYLLGN